jgi:hypothetical protein
MIHKIMLTSASFIPQVNITTISTPDIRSDLIVDLELFWSYNEFFQLIVDMETIAQQKGLDLSGGIGNFAKNLIPGDGEGMAELNATVSFRLGVGLEYVSAPSTKKINPYILGTTGLEVTLKAKGQFDYGIQAGALRGSIEMLAEISGKDPSDALSIKVGLNDSLNYYLGDPGNFSITRPGFVVSNISALISEVGITLDGAINANITAAISLIGISAKIVIGVTDLEKVGCKQSWMRAQGCICCNTLELIFSLQLLALQK